MGKEQQLQGKKQAKTMFKSEFFKSAFYKSLFYESIFYKSTFYKLALCTAAFYRFTDRIERCEVLLPIYHKYYTFRES